MSAQQRTPASAPAPSPYLFLATTMMFWGGAFSSSEAVVNHVPHTVAAMLRFGGGAVALLVAGGVDRSAPAVARGPKAGVRASARACLAGVLGVFAYNGFFFWGLSLAPSLDGGILIPVMSPVLTTSFLLISGREKASRRRLVGLALGLAGAAAYLIGANSAGGGSHRLARGPVVRAQRGVLGGVHPRRAEGAGRDRAADRDGVRDVHRRRAAGAGRRARIWAACTGARCRPRSGSTSPTWPSAPRRSRTSSTTGRVAAVGPASASLMMFLVPAVNTVVRHAVPRRVVHSGAGRRRGGAADRRGARRQGGHWPDTPPQADTPSGARWLP